MSAVRVRFVLPDGTSMTRSLSVLPGTGHMVRLQRDGVIYVAAPPEHLVGGLPYVTVRLTRAYEHRDDEPEQHDEEHLNEPAYLCCECGTISRVSAWLAVRWMDHVDPDAAPTLELDESGSGDPTLRCPACKHDHRDDDSGAGMYGDTVGQCIEQRERLIAERHEPHSVDWREVWLDKWNARADEDREALGHQRQLVAEATLRLADIAEMLSSVRTDEDGNVTEDTAALLSALDYALRGSSGCIDPAEWDERRRQALAKHSANVLGLTP